MERPELAYRVIQGLKWSRPCDRPACIPLRRPRGSKASGLRYERELARFLPAATHGQWFEFIDKNGPGFCQTDFTIRLGSVAVVLECKLSMTDEAWGQLESLYLPVVGMALERHPFGLVVTKHLRGVPQGFSVASSISEAINLSTSGVRTVFHWLGTPAQLKWVA